MKFIDKISSKKRWMFLVSGLFFILLCVIGYLGYKVFFHPVDKAYIFQQFGNIFYTEDQIRKMEKERFDRVKVQPPKARKTCSFTCVQNPNQTYEVQSRMSRVRRGRRGGRDDDEITNSGTLSNSISSDPHNETDLMGRDDPQIGRGYNNNSSDPHNETDLRGRDDPQVGRAHHNDDAERNVRYHGCCVSRRKLVKPDRLITVNNQSVRAVQFKSRTQVYWEDECIQIASCSGCTCYTEWSQIVVLVVDDDRPDNNDITPDEDEVEDFNFEHSRLEMVLVPGCCKCLNV